MSTKKITTSLTNKKYMLVGSYFCTYISYLLDFNTDDRVLFDTKTHIHLYHRY